MPVDIKAIFRSSLFWDADEIDSEKHAAYVISRVLEWGDIDDIHTLRRIYDDDQITHVIRKRRGISPQTGKFWAVKLGIPFAEVSCLKKYYPKAPSR